MSTEIRFSDLIHPTMSSRKTPENMAPPTGLSSGIESIPDIEPVTNNCLALGYLTER
jgi:hypothetical protein